jgi:hypothetical protein
VLPPSVVVVKSPPEVKTEEMEAEELGLHGLPLTLSDATKIARISFAAIASMVTRNNEEEIAWLQSKF